MGLTPDLRAASDRAVDNLYRKRDQNVEGPDLTTRVILKGAPVAAGLIAAASTWEFGPVVMGAAGGAAWGATEAWIEGYIADHSRGQISRDMAVRAAIFGAAGAVGGAAARWAGVAAENALIARGVTCANGLGLRAGFLIGAAEGGAFGGAEGFVRQGLLTGNLVDAVYGGIEGGLTGAGIGGALGAIFHQVCFTARTLVWKEEGKKEIKGLRVGQRVLTEETKDRVGQPGDDPTDVDPATWRLVRLRTAKPAGSNNLVDVELLRPLAWFEQTRVVAGSQIHFELAELGINGPADVLAIEPCPEIEPGHGRVITGTFRTTRCEVLEVRLCGQEEVLEPTPPHRFFSETRQEWVAAGELRVGECLRTASGQAVTVESIGLKAGEHRVYNLEVETEHQFYVGESGVLVHNQYADGFQNIVSERFPNGEHQLAARKGYPGIGRTIEGGPDFAGTEYLYPTAEGQLNSVRIKLTGSYADDFADANALARIYEQPGDYVWHHVDDFDPITGEGTLQLVRRDAHIATYPHAGGVSQYENCFGTEYTYWSIR